MSRISCFTTLSGCPIFLETFLSRANSHPNSISDYDEIKTTNPKTPTLKSLILEYFLRHPKYVPAYFNPIQMPFNLIQDLFGAALLKEKFVVIQSLLPHLKDDILDLKDFLKEAQNVSWFMNKDDINNDKNILTRIAKRIGLVFKAVEFIAKKEKKLPFKSIDCTGFPVIHSQIDELYETLSEIPEIDREYLKEMNLIINFSKLRF